MNGSQHHLPQNPQALSPLFDLPLELRCMILRYSLGQEEPIVSTARANRIDAGYYTENCGPVENEYILSFWEVLDNTKRTECPPILRTCQRLRQEGLPIFYEENTLEILWTPCSVRLPLGHARYCCDILNGSKTFSTDLESFQIDRDELDLSSLSTTSDNSDDSNIQRNHDVSYLDLQARQLQKFAPIISKCKKFHVKLELLDLSNESCLIMCRALRHILKDCHVTIESHDLAAYNGSEELVMRKDWLQYFRVLRCKSLEFLGRTDPFFGCDPDYRDEVIGSVTGNEPVQDTFKMWKDLWASPLAPMPTEACYQDFRAGMLSKFVRKVHEYDLDVYEEWRERTFGILGDRGVDRERLRQMALENSQNSE